MGFFSLYNSPLAFQPVSKQAMVSRGSAYEYTLRPIAHCKKKVLKTLIELCLVVNFRY